MMKKLALGLVGFVGVAGLASANHIDVFSDFQEVEDTAPVDGAAASSTVATTSGGAAGAPLRTATVELVGSTSGNNASLSIGDSPNSDYSISSGAETNAIWALGYDYSGTATASIDLVNNAMGNDWDSLRLAGIQNNRSTLDLFVDITDTDGDTATFNINNLGEFDAALSTAGTQFFFEYTAFDNFLATDFTMVQSIELRIDGTDSNFGADAIFDSFVRVTQNPPAVVPVPASLLLLLVGALTMRARKQA